MASYRMQRIYQQIEDGKRVVSVTTREMPRLNMWLWRHGYSHKSNCMGGKCDVLITEKSEN